MLRKSLLNKFWTTKTVVHLLYIKARNHTNPDIFDFEGWLLHMFNHCQVEIRTLKPFCLAVLYSKEIKFCKKHSVVLWSWIEREIFHFCLSLFYLCSHHIYACNDLFMNSFHWNTVVCLLCTILAILKLLNKPYKIFWKIRKPIVLVYIY